MKALLLAAGLGSRLGTYTELAPKCLMPVGTQPLLGHWLALLNEVPVTEIFINTHYKSEAVNRFLKQNPLLPDSEKITTLHETELLGAMGTLKKVKVLLGGENLLVIHADNFFDGSLKSLIDAHQQRFPSELIATMMSFHSTSPETCGMIKTNDAGVLIEMREKDIHSSPGQANGGIFIFEPAVLELIQGSDVGKDLSTALVPRILGKTQVYQTTDTLIDIGRHESLKKVQNYRNKLEKRHIASEWHTEYMELVNIITGMLNAPD